MQPVARGARGQGREREPIQPRDEEGGGSRTTNAVFSSSSLDPAPLLLFFFGAQCMNCFSFLPYTVVVKQEGLLESNPHPSPLYKTYLAALSLETEFISVSLFDT